MALTSPKIGMLNFGITFHISGQLQPQSPSVEVVSNNNVLLSAFQILNKTMNYRLRWRHINTCCCVMCAHYAYVTIRRTLVGSTRFRSRHFVNKVSGQHFLAENKQEAAEFYHQHLPVHSLGVIWKTKSKSNFPVSFSLISAEINLVGNYRTLRGLQTVNPEGLPSTIWRRDLSSQLDWFPMWLKQTKCIFFSWDCCIVGILKCRGRHGPMLTERSRHGSWNSLRQTSNRSRLTGR